MISSWTVVVGAIAILLAIGLSFRAPNRLRDALFGPPMSDDARRIIAILLVGGFALWLGIDQKPDPDTLRLVRLGSHAELGF